MRRVKNEAPASRQKLIVIVFVPLPSLVTSEIVWLTEPFPLIEAGPEVIPPPAGLIAALDPFEQFSLTLESTPAVAWTPMEFSVGPVVMRQLFTTLTVTPSRAVAVDASAFGFWRKRINTNSPRSRLANFRSVEAEPLTLDLPPLEQTLSEPLGETPATSVVGFTACSLTPMVTKWGDQFIASTDSQ